MSEESGFRFYISSGLLTAEHVHRIGTAVWEFMWLISHETREEGRVLNGSPITTSRIAQELGESKRTAKRNLTRLYEEGYIVRYRSTPGAEYSYTIANSKKWVSTGDKSGTGWGQKWHGVVPEMSPGGDKNDTANKEGRKVYRVDRVDNDDFHPLNYATKILEDLNFPVTPDYLKVVSACVESEIKAGKTPLAAYEFISTNSRAARLQGTEINRFFFTDAKYRLENQTKGKTAPKRKGEYYRDATEILREQRELREKEEAENGLSS